LYPQDEAIYSLVAARLRRLESLTDGFDAALLLGMRLRIGFVVFQKQWVKRKILFVDYHDIFMSMFVMPVACST
jgi:hypothetical protein